MLKRLIVGPQAPERETTLIVVHVWVWLVAPRLWLAAPRRRLPATASAAKSAF